jgi:hypothetical protein
MNEQERNKRPRAPQVRSATPKTPKSEKTAKPQAASGDAFPIVDDESDLVSFSAPVPGTGVRRNAPPATVHHSMFLRRTMVPILLSGGVGLPLLGGLWFKSDADSPFRVMGVGLPIGLIAVGAVFLLVGILNVMQLRRELRGPGVLKHASPKNQ